MATHPAHSTWSDGSRHFPLAGVLALENLRELPLYGVGSDRRTMFLGVCLVLALVKKIPLPGLLSARADCSSVSVLNTGDAVGVRGMLHIVKHSGEWRDAVELLALFVVAGSLNFSHLGSVNTGSQVL